MNQESNGASPRSRWDRRLLSLSGLQMTLVVFLGCLIFLLKNVGYASSWLERGTPQAQAPSPNFDIGTVHWDVTGYASEPALEPLREFYRETCKDQKGLAAALLLAEEFSYRFPFESPKVDFFEAQYSLMEDFRAHVERGEPGHCVTMSGLMAAVLLSAGCPARVVQVYSPHHKGHNMVEIWDQNQGWVFIDPSYMAWVRCDEVLGSSRPGDKPIVHKIGRTFSGVRANRPSENLNVLYFDPKDGLMWGPRTYPEPWLYLRLGPRAAPWPFRGRIVVDGPSSWRLGTAQHALWAGIAINVVLLHLCLAWQVQRYFASQASSYRLRWRAYLAREAGTSSVPGSEPAS
jgi:hypothetical protein